MISGFDLGKKGLGGKEQALQGEVLGVNVRSYIQCLLHLMSDPIDGLDLEYILVTPLNPYSAPCPNAVYAFSIGNHHTYSLVLVQKLQYMYTLLAEIVSRAILYS